MLRFVRASFGDTPVAYFRGRRGTTAAQQHASSISRHGFLPSAKSRRRDSRARKERGCAIRAMAVVSVSMPDGGFRRRYSFWTTTRKTDIFLGRPTANENEGCFLIRRRWALLKISFLPALLNSEIISNDRKKNEENYEEKRSVFSHQLSAEQGLL